MQVSGKALFLVFSRYSQSRFVLRQFGVSPGDRVTYRRHEQSRTVVSGYTAENRNFYRETMLACEGRKWHNLAFEYPASDKQAMDESVTRASYALAAYSRAGC
jgi:hypothetical protein